MGGIYSISRLNTINNCLHEAYYTYRLNDRGEKNIYTIMGSSTHECLQHITEGTATEADLLPAFKQELENISLFGLSFPKDMKGEDSVRTNYIANMEHFAKNYKAPKNKQLQAELEVNYISPAGNKLVGYIDLLKTNNDGSVEVYDYKSSAMYQKKDMLEKARQLVVYNLALKQAGYNVKSVSFIFLKYVDITYMGYKTVKSKAKTKLTKTVERRKIVKELESSIRCELAEQNCSDLEIDFLMEDALKNNEIPTQVAHLYSIKPCVIPYAITDEIEQECIEYIDNTVEMWENLSDEECKAAHREFTKTQKNGKVVSDTYYCGALCPHKNKCIHYQDFIAQWVTSNEDSQNEDLF